MARGSAAAARARGVCREGIPSSLLTTSWEERPLSGLELHQMLRI